MDEILANLQSWRDNRSADDLENIDSGGSDSEDEEYKAYKLLYMQHRDVNNLDDEQPLTSRLANEKTVCECFTFWHVHVVNKGYSVSRHFNTYILQYLYSIVVADGVNL